MATVCVAVPLGPACVDLTGVRAGDLNRFTATITQKGLPLDLTGMVLTAQARKSPRSTDPLDAVVEVVDAVAGEVLIRWPGEDVRTWIGNADAKDGVWDLQVASPGEDPVTVAEGKFKAKMDVTR